MLSNPDVQISICLAIIVALFYFLISSNAQCDVEKQQAIDNLGEPASLRNATAKFYASNPKNQFAMSCFIPCKKHANPTETDEKRRGIALLIHPDYPSDAKLFNVLFLWNEEICTDGRTLYEIVADEPYNPYLRKVKS